MNGVTTETASAFQQRLGYTFRSLDLGMLGYADPDGRIAIYRKPARRHAPDTEFDMRGRTERIQGELDGAARHAQLACQRARRWQARPRQQAP